MCGSIVICTPSNYMHVTINCPCIFGCLYHLSHTEEYEILNFPCNVMPYSWALLSCTCYWEGENVKEGGTSSVSFITCIYMYSSHAISYTFFHSPLSKDMQFPSRNLSLDCSSDQYIKYYLISDYFLHGCCWFKCKKKTFYNGFWNLKLP